MEDGRMKIARWLSVIAAVAWLGSSGSALAQETGLAPEVEQKLDLTDAQVKAFLAATDLLRKAGGKSPAHANQFAKDLPTSQKALAIIEKNGFKDITEFQRVGYNAAMAYNVVQEGGKEAVKASLDKFEAQQKTSLEKLRVQVKPDQFALLEAQAAKSLQARRAMQDVPDRNIELMKKYGDRMAKLGKN
jgi:hypothetical protein